MSGRFSRASAVSALTVALAVIGGTAAWAATWTETGDAGSLPGTAQTPTGAGALTQISGQATGNNDVDTYRICISDPAAFSAETSGTVVDPQQFLFDASGRGVVANDDIVQFVQRQSRISAGSLPASASPGVYYLALSRWDNEPLSAGGAIFPNASQGVVGPTGPGGASPVTGYNNNGNPIGEPTGNAYAIALTGTRFCDQQGTIDVKPGSTENPVNLKSKGVIPVAILTTPDFDATTVDPATACFGDAEAPAQRDCTEAHGQGHPEDVDADGDVDLVLHFETQETGIDAGDTQACLTAAGANGETVRGCDAITLKP